MRAVDNSRGEAGNYVGIMGIIIYRTWVNMTGCCGSAVMTVWIKMYHYWFFCCFYHILNLHLFNANSPFYPGGRICCCSLLIYEYLSVQYFHLLVQAFIIFHSIAAFWMRLKIAYLILKSTSSSVAAAILSLRSFLLIMKIQWRVWRNRICFLFLFFVSFLVWLLDLSWIEHLLKRAKHTNKRILHYQITSIFNQVFFKSLSDSCLSFY